MSNLAGALVSFRSEGGSGALRQLSAGQGQCHRHLSWDVLRSNGNLFGVKCEENDPSPSPSPRPGKFASFAQFRVESPRV